MEALILLAVASIGFILVGSIVAFINLSGMRGLKSEIKKLKQTVSYQHGLIENLLTTQNTNANSDQPPVLSDDMVESPVPSADLNTADTGASVDDEPTKSEKRLSMAANAIEQIVKLSPTQSSRQAGAQSVKAHAANNKPKVNFSLDTFLQGNGLLWLGAVVLALGGVFLAKYSIEAGLFPPSLRIILGGAFGVVLIVLAEYLYTNPKRFNIHSSMISAALASGGVITCFSMTLVAFDFYEYLSPSLAFIILACIATAATWMSVRYGPILALVGVVGAYIVPALVTTGSNNVFALLVYISFVSVSTLWVHAYVKQQWLWWLSVLGHFGWLLISVNIGYYDYQWVIFVYCLFSIYLFVFVPIVGPGLNQTEFVAMPIKSLLMPRKEQLGILLPVAALILSNVDQAVTSNLLLMLFILSVVLLVAPFRHSAFDTWPFIAVGLCVLVFLKMPSTYDYADNLFPFTGGYLFAQVSALGFVIYSVLALMWLKNRPSFLLLLVFSPLMIMGLAYALSAPQAAPYLYPVWSISLMLVACVFAYFGLRENSKLHKMTYIMLANGALTLTLTMLLSSATLSLAIVAQVALMAFLSSRYKIAMPNWLYKIAIGVVLLRLTAAPWLEAYTNETIAGVNWSLIVYPLVLVLLWLTYKFLSKDDIKAWCIGALLHVVALFVTTETSYLISGSNPTLFALSYGQAIFLSMNYLILGAVYLWRKQSASQPFLYVAYSSVLLGVSALLHLYLSVFSSPFIFDHDMGSGVFINLLLPLWAIPALVITAMLYWRLISDKFRSIAWGVAGIFGVFYINGFIRGIYHPGLSLAKFDILQQELYVYSIVWLMAAVGLILLAQMLNKAVVNKAGFCILSLVVFKAFLIDMSSLDGLYRALSFIGLGLCLVGIGWLFQRLNHKPALKTHAVT